MVNLTLDHSTAFTLFTLLGEGLFLVTVLMHVARKNRSLVSLYLIHSFLLALILTVLAIVDKDPSVLIVVALTLVVKVWLASRYFGRLLGAHHLSTASGAYLNLPIPPLAITAITAFTHTERLQGLFLGEFSHISALALATILIAFFLIINRQGALSQIVGVLALENGIIALAAYLGLKLSALVEFGLAFDLAVWISVATVFLGMVQQQFGSIATTEMDQLKEE